MMRFAKIFVALLCIVCVLALCVAPYADIPVTILKSLRILLLLMFSLAAGALTLVSLFHWVSIRYVITRVDHKTHIQPLSLPFETNCVQQC
jgi:hypothetical protein